VALSGLIIACPLNPGSVQAVFGLIAFSMLTIAASIDGCDRRASGLALESMLRS
jgi:hypothetical protein